MHIEQVEEAGLTDERCPTAPHKGGTGVSYRARVDGQGQEPVISHNQREPRREMKIIVEPRDTIPDRKGTSQPIKPNEIQGDQVTKGGATTSSYAQENPVHIYTE
jgi:hypothetical protein